MKFFAVAVVFFCLISTQVLACSCEVGSFGPEASKKNIARAKYIVQGRVSFVAPENEEKIEKYKGLTAFGITVSKTLKGDDMKMLSAYAVTFSTCGVSIPNLKRQTFFILYMRGGGYDFS